MKISNAMVAGDRQPFEVNYKSMLKGFV